MQGVSFPYTFFTFMCHAFSIGSLFYDAIGCLDAGKGLLHVLCRGVKGQNKCFIDQS